MADVEALEKELKEALGEIENLKLRLSNVTLMLRREMQQTRKLPEADESSKN